MEYFTICLHLFFLEENYFLGYCFTTQQMLLNVYPSLTYLHYITHFVHYFPKSLLLRILHNNTTIAFKKSSAWLHKRRLRSLKHALVCNLSRREWHSRILKSGFICRQHAVCIAHCATKQTTGVFFCTETKVLRTHETCVWGFSLILSWNLIKYVHVRCNKMCLNCHCKLLLLLFFKRYKY